MLLRTALLLVVVSTTVILGDEACLRLENIGGGQYYFAHHPRDKTDFNGAKVFCHKHGMHLVRFDRSGEFDAVAARVGDFIGSRVSWSGFWTGLADYWHADIFKDLDTQTLPVGTQWVVNQPDHPGDSDAAVLVHQHRGIQLDDQGTTEKHNFICEKN